MGVDLHPDSFSAAFVTGAGLSDMKLERSYTKIDCKEWEKFLEGIPRDCTIVCEAGSNSFEFMRRAQCRGYKTIVLNSVSAGQIGKAYCKTDKKDALRTAKIYLCGLSESVWQPDEETTMRREIISAYKQATTDRTRCSNRIKSFLTEHKIRLKKKANVGNPIIQQQIKKSYHWSPEQLFVLENMFDALRDVTERRKKYYEFIARTVFGNLLMVRLMNLCGIRLLAAYELLAAIGDIERFKTPKALVAYIGLAPSIHASGSRSISGGIQKGGKMSVKATLIESANSILKSKSPCGEKLRKWGVALMMRKNKNVAVGGIARKLLVAVWYALKGFLPEILDAEKSIQSKLSRLASELTLPFIQSLGYKKIRDFVEEYTLIVLTGRNLT